MTQISVISKSTFVKKISFPIIALSLGLFANVGYDMYRENQIRVEKEDKHKNARNWVLYALNEKDYIKAQELLKINGPFFSPSEKVEFELKLEREKEINKFTRLIDAEDYTQGKKLLNSFTTEGKLPKPEIKKLEDVLESISENGVYSTFLKSHDSNKIAAAEKYLRMFPLGTHKKETIEGIISTRASIVINHFRDKNNPDYFEVYGAIENLSISLDSYSKFESKLNLGINLKEFELLASSYITRKITNLYSKSNEDIKENDTVKIIRNQTSISSWNEKYYAERNAVIKYDSIGKIIGIETTKDGKIAFTVKFTDGNPGMWNTEWDIESKYWKLKGTKLIGSYRTEELIKLVEIGEIEKNRFNHLVTEVSRKIAVVSQDGGVQK